MKVPKSARKAKQSTQKSVSKPQPNKPGKEIVETLRNLIEAARAESDDSTLIAVMMPANILSSQLEDLEGMLGEGLFGDDLLGLLSPNEILKLHIVEMIYGDETMPQSMLELIYLILRHRVALGEESGELMARVLKKIYFPPEELKKIFSEQMEEEEKAAQTVRRRRPRYGRQ